MSRRDQRQAKKAERTLTWVLGLLGLLVVIAVAAFWVGTARRAPVPPAPVEGPAPAPSLREVVLYFADLRGEYLVAEHREMADCPFDEPCVRALVEALIQGPRTDLVPVLPAQTQVLGVFFEGETVTLDLSRDLVTRHPGGSISELLSIYGLANTLAANFPQLRQVRILVAGQVVESLKGHVDLRAPIPADFRYGRPPQRADGRPTEGERQ
ncbi:GerMN domain-containing protein [Geoalkalibacter sp.]|uniref:GerMN domain-containing protein n=1 Tax=Geoalkalibacter sp. TaxID=3041440 RepID=UPI00272EA392|nr:GerMN domain-containing protein [Geoalkalibacter sp.]